MRYQNEPCCGCGVPLQPQTDDIVVCPDCGAPQHRHCWLEKGQCALAEQHGEGSRWEPTIEPEEEAPEPSEEAQIICPECGDASPQGAEHCRNCGTNFGEFSQTVRIRFEQDQQRREQYMKENFPTYELNGRSVSMGDTVAGQPLEEIALQLRGPRRAVNHYLKRFERNGKVGWNWAAFFFGPYWFFFRKLYQPAILMAGLWLAALMAFSPMQSRMLDAFEEDVMPYALQSQKALQQGDEEAYGLAEQNTVKSMRRLISQYRWLFLGKGAQWLLTALVSALLADPLLRKKILRNIEYAHQDGDSPVQKFGRHQLLIRMGGFNFFAPMAYFWVSWYLPTLLVQLITWLTG